MTEKIYMDAHTYAYQYVLNFNEKPDKLNCEYRKQGLGNYLQVRRLNIMFWLDEELISRMPSETCLGTYTPNGISSSKSTMGLIKINLKAHKGNLKAVKETIRHEIAHAIAHQIQGCKDNHHNEIWMEIAEEHEVNIDRYKKDYQTAL